MSVHPRIGPYITMAGKMVLAMSYIIALLMVTLMAFGVGSVFLLGTFLVQLESECVLSLFILSFES